MMYPTAGAGTIILICVLLLACGFAAGFIIAKAFASLKPRKRMVRGFDTPAQMVSRRDVSLEEYAKNSAKHSSDGQSAVSGFSRQ